MDVTIFTDHPPRYLEAARKQLVNFYLQRFVKKSRKHGIRQLGYSRRYTKKLLQLA